MSAQVPLSRNPSVRKAEGGASNLPLTSSEPVVFQNQQGLRLFGILHTPPVPAGSDLAVVLLSPGIKMRVGPARLYRGLTTLLTGMGLPVLRFDFAGLGDSEGALTEELVRDVYNHIEVGRFVQDAIDAMDWMEDHCGTRRFIFAGLCGGAVTGLLAGSKDPRVAGLLALGITPVLASQAADPSLYLTAGQLRQLREGYYAKLRDPRAWLRLLTFQSDYKVMWKSVARPIRPPGPATAADAAAAPQWDNASPLFPPAFFSMLETKRPMLLIFGGSDRLQWEFEEKFVARHSEKLKELPPLYDVHVIEHANHVLSFVEWQREMLATAEQWFKRHFQKDLRR
jgi:pimeloyl-ACP methyl ester carboxylesterase